MLKIAKTVLLATFSSVFFFSTPSLAMASVPSDISIARLAQVAHFDDSFKIGVKKGFMNSLITKLKADPKFQRLTPTEQQRYLPVVENFGEKVIQDLNTPELTQKALTAFTTPTKKYYSQEEVDALTNFYQTPIGQSIIKKQSQACEDFSQSLIASMENDPQFQQKLINSAKIHSTEFMEEIKKIKNSR